MSFAINWIQSAIAVIQTAQEAAPSAAFPYGNAVLLDARWLENARALTGPHRVGQTYEHDGNGNPI